MQHRDHRPHLVALRQPGEQADQLAVVVLPLFGRGLRRRHIGEQTGAAYGFGLGPIGQFVELHQQPAGMVAGGAHGEDPPGPFGAQSLTRREPAFGLVGSRRDGDLTAYPWARPITPTTTSIVSVIRAGSSPMTTAPTQDPGRGG